MTKTIRQLLGINAGKEWDQIYSDRNPYGYNPLKNIFSSVRSFHLMEDDYPFGKIPANAAPDVALPGGKRGWAKMNNYNLRYKKWKNDFPSIRATLSSIVKHNESGKVMSMRKFPNAWYSMKEWGASPTEIKRNAALYANAFFRLHNPVQALDYPLINVLEIGNEPWGDIGVNGFQQVAKGIISAYKEYYKESPNLALSIGAFQAHNPNNVWKCKTCSYPSGDFIGNMLDEEILAHITELTVHPYSFTIGTVQLTEPPESTSSDFSHVSSMFAYRNKMGKHLKMASTEFGWDSETVGELVQGLYLVRNILQMASMGFDALYLYEGIDNPGLKGLYGSSGLFKATQPGRVIGAPKMAYKVLLQLVHELGDRQFKQAIATTDNVYALLFGTDEQMTHLVVWRPENISQQDQPDQPAWVKLPNSSMLQPYQLDSRFTKLDGQITMNNDLTFVQSEKAHPTSDILKRTRNEIQIKASPVPYVFKLIN